jgi:hypothetical protein
MRVDLRLTRLPLHLVQKLPPPPAAAPSPEPPAVGWSACSVGACLACMAPLFWIVSLQPEDNGRDALEGRANVSGCLYLLVSPLTTPLLLHTHMQHPACGRLTIALAMGAILLGNAAAVLACAGCRTQGRLWLASAAMVASVAEKLWLAYKGNPILLMLSTASAVVVCCLALAAPLMPVASMTYRCYQSITLPMCWLFWQAGSGPQRKAVVRVEHEVQTPRSMMV